LTREPDFNKMTLSYIFAPDGRPPPMSERTQLCTLDEITDLVHGFYARVRADGILGPIFDARIDDWPTHLATMVRFWSSLLIGAGTYRGSPMSAHVALPGLQAELFQRWLALFHETTASLENHTMARRAEDYAQRIARSLWFGYQINRNPEQPPSEIPHG